MIMGDSQGMCIFQSVNVSATKRLVFFPKSLSTLLSVIGVVTLISMNVNSIFAQAAVETDWPQWRGANRDDVSLEDGLLKEWPEGGPTKLWTNRDGGLGYAGFAVVGDRLYTMGATDDNQFALCLNVSDGSEVWRKSIDSQFNNRWGDGPRNTPSIDGDNAYFLSASGTLACLNAADGSEKWSVSLTEDFGGKTPYWGYSESPFVDDDKILCTPGGSEGAIVALDKLTGKVVWRTRSVTSACHYSSIVSAEIDGKKQYIQLFEKSLIGVEAETGVLLWEEAWRGRTAVIPTPIVDGNKVYVSSGYGVGSMLVDISDPANTSQIWFSNKMKNHHGGVILKDGHYYGYSDRIGWACQSADSGELVWSEKDALGKGAIAYADGCFYLISENEGVVVLIDASSEGWKEKGRFTLDPQSPNRKPDGRIWVHPVVSNGKLYLRDQEFISCFDVSDPNQ